MKIFITLLLLLNFVRAEFVFDDMMPPVKEEIIDYDSTSNEPEEVIPEEELNKNSEQILDDVIQTKESIESDNSYKKSYEQNIFLTLISSPKKVILSQRVPITIKATLARTDLNSIKAYFPKSSDYIVLNPDAKWQKLNENSYKTTYYLKYLSTKVSNKNVKVEVKFENRSKSSSTITIPKPKVVALKSDEFFSGVIAKEFEVISHSEKKYDDRYNIILMELNATLSNLGDFSVPYAKKSGVDEHIDKGETQKAYAYAIVDNRAKNFKFRYFNSKINHYKMISFDIVLKDQTLSTQTELNPQKNKYKIYKTIALLVVTFIILLVAIRKKSIVLSVIMIILFAYIAYINLPFKTITLKKGVGLKILPTQNSTIFYIVPYDLKATVAYENKKYYKVILPDGKLVGWVKKNVVK
jgi:hypothetical protein